jgi:cytochrome c oxidase cbb3-type subunit 3
VPFSLLVHRQTNAATAIRRMQKIRSREGSDSVERSSVNWVSASSKQETRYGGSQRNRYPTDGMAIKTALCPCLALDRGVCPSRFSPAGMIALLALALCACSVEKRTLGPDQPGTAPNGPDDPRISTYKQNRYQVSQGARYFGWYGCQGCHAGGTRGVRDLADDAWKRGGSFDKVYAAVEGQQLPNHSYGSQIPVEQKWQITAYILSLKETGPEMRRRGDLDQQGEPQGPNWSGPIR